MQSIVKKYFLPLGCVLFSLLSGCATAPRVKDALPIQSYVINRELYYPLSSLCEYLKINWEYDSFSRQVNLKRNSSEIKLLLDSPVVLVNGYPQEIRAGIVLHKGIVCVPHIFKQEVLDKFPILGKEAEAKLQGVKRIVMDPGHGGSDPGAIGKSGIREKNINFDIANRMAKILQDNRIDIIWTRTTDEFVSLEDRARIANQSGADLLVSIHTNSARSNRLSGFEVFYISEKADDLSRAELAAKNGYAPDSSIGNQEASYTKNRADSIALAHSICSSAIRNMGLKILGVKGAQFYVLKGTPIPGVLVEVGFISNPQEEMFLKNGFYRQQLAEMLAEGVINYGKQYYLRKLSLSSQN